MERERIVIKTPASLTEALLLSPKLCFSHRSPPRNPRRFFPPTSLTEVELTAVSFSCKCRGVLAALGSFVVKRANGATRKTRIESSPYGPPDVAARDAAANKGHTQSGFFLSIPLFSPEVVSCPLLRAPRRGQNKRSKVANQCCEHVYGSAYSLSYGPYVRVPC